VECKYRYYYEAKAQCIPREGTAETSGTAYLTAEHNITEDFNFVCNFSYEFMGLYTRQFSSVRGKTTVRICNIYIYIYICIYTYIYSKIVTLNVIDGVCQ
jgi:hypothetical protein